MRKVRLSVPASTANLGPGFDCLALALELRNTLELEIIDSGLVIDLSGKGADGELPRDTSNLMVQAARRVFEHAKAAPQGLRLRADNRIPLSAGLGSSAAAVVAAMAGANELVQAGLSTEQLLRMATEMEGHPDNAAASLYGGLNVVSAQGEELLVRQVPLPPLKAAVAVPRFRLSTSEMRKALPRQVSLETATFNLGRALLTVEALRGGDYALLSSAMRDRLHEPVRRRHIPGFEKVSEAAREAGAAGVALSGAGPSVVAFASSHHDTVARAMVDAWAEAGVEAEALVVPVAGQGVTRVDPQGDSPLG